MATATTPIGYKASTDPKQVAANNRLLLANQAQNLYGQGQDLTDATKQDQAEAQGLVNQSGQIYGTEQGARGSTADYLNNVEDPLAQGNGGYNANETSQIEMTPEQKQQMVTSAGISAGTNTAAATDAAQRATAAAGGNPAALAAYRARAASNVGAQAGDAQTQARVAAQQAGAGEAENVGTTRLGQQTQGLNYYQGQNAQANSNAQNALGLQEEAQGLTNQATGLQSQALGNENQTYGTQTSGAVGTGNTAQAASQNPTTFDKTMGAIGGALSFLDDGDSGSGEPAVIGENGPEAVVKMSKSYMDGGDVGSGETETEGNALPTDGAGDAGGSGEADPRSWFQKTMTKVRQQNQQQQQQQQSQPQFQPQSQQSGTPTAVKSWNTVGQGVGKIASMFMEDGDIMPDWRAAGGRSEASEIGRPDAEQVAGRSYRAMGGEPAHVSEMFNSDGGVISGPGGALVTKPTKVMLAKDDAVVPLNYRARAKVRPSAAMPLIRNLQQAHNYGRV
jgi:hypothetical protein